MASPMQPPAFRPRPPRPTRASCQSPRQPQPAMASCQPQAATASRGPLLEARGFQTKLRQKFDDLDKWFRVATRRAYPRTADALRHLRQAIDAELGSPIDGQPQAAPKRKRTSQSRKHYHRARRLQIANVSLRKQIAIHSDFKAGGNLLSPEMIVRIFLSLPSSNARGLATSFRDVLGFDTNTVSRPSIGKVRDAWVEFYKAMVLKVAGERVVADVAAAKSTRAEFAPLYALHVQDEAELRLRDRGADGLAILRRGRSSKVQQNVVELITKSGSIDIPTELEALGDKSAATLATSFERILRSEIASVLPATSGDAQPQAAANAQPRAAATDPEIWLFHILVGDGIATNEAAAKRLWACLQQQGLGPRTRYFLLLLICGTHQAGLAAKSAVAGRSASVARGKLYRDVAGVTVRLFKYLINDYYDEFVFSVNEWVLRELEVLPPQAADAAAQAETARMQLLYTTHVLPDELLTLWNNGLRRMCHVLDAGQDPKTERPRVVALFVQWIVKHLLHVDSRPILTRFFTFRNCTDRMFTMGLIGAPSHVFQVRSIKPRKENQKRLRIVKAFFNHEEAPQTLRRTSLAFQLTGGVEAMVSEVPAPGKTPPVVRLCRNEATLLVQERLQRILECMAESYDPVLDCGAATGALVAVSMELVIRMQKFQDYPAALCKMSKKWFPYKAARSVLDFLAADPKQLDVGAGLPLQRLALEKGSEAAAAHWLQSEPVQAIFNRLAEVMLANSLAAERASAQVKKWETSKLTHIAIASRNAMTTRFLRWRVAQCEAIEAALKKLRKAERTNVTALAWQQAGAARPRGARWSASRQPDTRSASTKPATLAAAASTKPATLAPEARAKLQNQKDSAIEEASAHLDRTLRSFSIPVTREQWSAWLAAILPQFRDKMVTAPGGRRKLSTRRRARPGMPDPVKRIQPQAEAVDNSKVRAPWALNLQNRMGWHGVTTRRQGGLIVFLIFLRGRTYFLKVAKIAVGSAPTFLLDKNFAIAHAVHELRHFESLLVDDEVLKTWELDVRGVAEAGTGVCMTIERKLEITKPAPKPPRSEAADEEGSDEDDALVVLGSDAESSDVKVVDTDDESAVDASDAESEASSGDSASDREANMAGNFLKVAPAPAGISKMPATGGAAKRVYNPPLWEDAYFHVYASKHDYLEMRMRQQFKLPVAEGGMGAWSMSRRVTPQDFGETREDPVRSLLVLRAWALWRARQEGWADARACRARHFAEQETLLVRDVQKLGAHCRLLGHAKANAALREIAPDLVARLRG